MTAKLDREKIRKEFDAAVNMTAPEIEKWLKTEASKKVGFKGADGSLSESVGHASGKRIVKIVCKRRDELNDDDYAHMRKVVGYVHRHLAQKPEGDVTETKWRYSLLNWGHDPLKD